MIEVVDEGSNPFTWPNWFGILQALGHHHGGGGNNKVRLEEQPPLQNKIAPRDEQQPAEGFKSKYVQARKNQLAREEELTGNEIDGEVGSGEVKDGKVLFPRN